MFCNFETTFSHESSRCMWLPLVLRCANIAYVLRHSVILVLYSNGRVKHVLSSLSIFQHHTFRRVPAPLRHCGRACFFFSDGDFETQQLWFEGFEMKSMVEKHAKSLQGFAEEVIFDNLALFWVCPKGKTWWIKFHCCFFSSFFVQHIAFFKNGEKILRSCLGSSFHGWQLSDFTEIMAPKWEMAVGSVAVTPDGCWKLNSYGPKYQL